MNILVVGAHPDDELLGAGGTVARHVKNGDRVTLAILCEGITQRYDDSRHEVVQHQSRVAAEILGVNNVVIGSLPDQRLDTLPISTVAQGIEEIVRDVEPEIVYTHFPADLNRDHRIAAEATMIATRPYASKVRELLAFETPSSTEWGAIGMSPSFQPSVFVDITDTLETKLKAFAVYEAEVREPPHPRSLESLRSRASSWGSIVGVRSAEAFVPLRILR